MRGDDHYGRAGIVRQDARQQRQPLRPVGAVRAVIHVEQDHVIAGGRKPRQRLLRSGGAVDPVAAEAQRQRDRFGDAGIVVDQQHRQAA
jgi:hypothetical protein